MLTVYLADLRHNFGGVLSTDCMPLGIGYMGAVIARDFPRDEVKLELFASAPELVEAMDSCPPDVLMVSNYVWNERLSAFCLRRARRLNPNVLNVMGGPNIHVEPDRQLSYVENRPEIDVYVLGEGDFVARDILQAWIQSGRSIEAMGEMEIPSSIYRRGGQLIRTCQTRRAEANDLNNVPSPWLNGLMDKFFDGKLAPLLETNRGCPFSCSFCVQGTDYYTKVSHFTLDRMREEIDYIGRRIRSHSPSMGILRIADANYGMFPRDTEISAYIGQAQRDYGWPTFLDATTGKNRPENVIRSMEQVNGGIVIYQSVQSLEEEVLRRIRRSNIKLSAYAQIAVHVRGRGMRSSTDLILGLPGDSLQTHLSSLHKMIDLGTEQAHCFQLMMLKGSDLESLASRNECKFEVKYRLGPKNFGEYGGEKVFDIEEIVVANDELSFDDYLTCRKHHLTFSVFWNDSWFSDVVAVAGRCGVPASVWLSAMLSAMERDGGAVGEFLQKFVTETQGEIFDSIEECAQFYSEPAHFDQLCRGQIGDNLMYKYRALASFFVWEDICRLAMEATRSLLVENGTAAQFEEFDTLWTEFARYVELRHAASTEIAELKQPVEAGFLFDIPGWLAAGTPFETAPFRRAEARRCVFQLSDDGALELESALQVWTAKSIGLSKLITRIRYTAQVRDCLQFDRGEFEVSDELPQGIAVPARLAAPEVTSTQPAGALAASTVQ
ncbi:B12-binding domain-containing radical SAM protein [uncultured Paludibaculum sp.]|uniref:B12-binding domain-containing radical SAM protein n=1 Tax=uncultured Paludibaculum sp. TaxID=1765020 RepID=UPI002AAAC54A|nr:radical SAM protein [uncultured Paludibaculum sp.]